MTDKKVDVAKLDFKERKYLETLIKEKEKRDLCLLYSLFPTKDRQLSDKVVAYGINKYKKHQNFFEIGNKVLVRVFRAGNRCGKSWAGAYELSCHLTGIYPEWWKGRRYDRPVKAWAASTTAIKTRDIIQFTLCGSPDSPHLRFIPEHLTLECTPKHGTPKAFNDVYVRHISGGISVVTFKDYKQERQAFEGTTIDVVWLDEEAPKDIFDESRARIMNPSGLADAPNGILFLTFTPLQGLTPLIQYLMQEAKSSSNTQVITAEWNDVPHLSEAAKEEMLQGMPPHIRDARMRGIPFLGTGQIFPVPLEDVLVDPFKIPPHWHVAYGLDEGLGCTAGVWGALDPDTDILYVYNEYVGRNQLAFTNARAVKERGMMPGAIDNSAMRTSPTDGIQIIQAYYDEGLELVLADKSVESGIQKIWERLNTGRLKLFKTCVFTRAEYEIYHRDADGQPVRHNIHLMDALRYLVNTGIDIAIPYLSTMNGEIPYQNLKESQDNFLRNSTSTTGRNPITGY